MKIYNEEILKFFYNKAFPKVFEKKNKFHSFVLYKITPRLVYFNCLSYIFELLINKCHQITRDILDIPCELVIN